jgi:hypothetical protein
MLKGDWILLVLAEVDFLSPVQLQKALFVIGDKLCPEGFYEFEPYDYGPFCKEVYAEASTLEIAGFVQVDHSNQRSYRTYSATPLGYERASNLKRELSERERAFVEKVVAWVRRLPFQKLVSSIYKAYPHMKANSVFQD